MSSTEGLSDFALGLAGSASKEIVTLAVDRAKKAFSERLGDIAQNLRNRAVVDLRLGFEDFLTASYSKCERFKTILAPNEPISVKDHYVNMNLSLNSKFVKDSSLIERVHTSKCVVVTGLAGTGKSMFMKYLTICLFESNNGNLPLFVELRHLNSVANKILLAFIRAQCSSKANSVSSDQFELALKNGVFTLILDGFDELDYDCRDEIEKQILQLHREYPNLTSRP